MTELTTQEANQKLAELMSAVNTLMTEAQSFADEHGLTIHYEGPEYGMGGWYSDGEWTASSQSC